MSSFADTNTSSSLSSGQANVIKHLEASITAKLEENVDLLQQLLEKEALYKQACATIENVKAYVQSCEDNAIGIDNVTASASVSETTITAPDAPIRVGEKLAPFNPTMDACIDIALDLLGLCPTPISSTTPPDSSALSSCISALSSNSEPSILYDLGCGDARLLIKACQRNFNVRGVGIEYDSQVIEKARLLVSAAGLGGDTVITPSPISPFNHLSAFKNSGHRILLVHENVLNVELPATCTHIFVYLVPAGMSALAGKYFSQFLIAVHGLWCSKWLKYKYNHDFFAVVWREHQCVL